MYFRAKPIIVYENHIQLKKKNQPETPNPKNYNKKYLWLFYITVGKESLFFV